MKKNLPPAQDPLDEQPYRLFVAVLHRAVIARSEEEARGLVQEACSVEGGFHLKAVKKGGDAYLEQAPDSLQVPSGLADLAEYMLFHENIGVDAGEALILEKLEKLNSHLAAIRAAFAEPTTFPCVQELELPASKIFELLSSVASGEKFSRDHRNYFALRYPRLEDVMIRIRESLEEGWGY